MGAGISLGKHFHQTLLAFTCLSMAGAVAWAGSDSSSSHGSGDGGQAEQVATIGTSSNSHGDTHESAADDHGTPHWTYDGADGPQNWGSLADGFGACADGSMQSPINFDQSAFNAAGTDISFDYQLTALHLINNGHTVQANYEAGSSITVNGEEFELLQFHFHSPSEHTIGSRQAPMEMHLVHRNAQGELAVVGVMMEIAGANRALNELWAHMPTHAGDTFVSDSIAINARDMLPADRSYYRYMGSLTTPPCTEGVNWYVMSEPIMVGMDQINEFSAAVGYNARPVQAHNGRLIIAPSSN